MKYGEIGCSLSHYFIWKDVSISMHVSFPEEGRTSDTFYVPATKWPGHVLLPMSVIPK